MEILEAFPWVFCFPKSRINENSGKPAFPKYSHICTEMIVYIKKWQVLYLDLKGQCHEDFAVLGQFWTKIVTLRLYSSTRRSCKAMTKILNEFYQRGLTMINFLRIF